MDLSSVHIPLLDTCDICIERLDIQATHAVDPPGSAASTGYDDVTGEPIVGYVSGAPAEQLRYMTPIYVPCQIENPTFERLRAVFGGDAPVTRINFVAHRRTLRRMSLINASTGKCLLKPRDKITGVFRGRARTQVMGGFDLPLYVYEVRPGSFGVGRDGYSLEIIYVSQKDVGADRG